MSASAAATLSALLVAALVAAPQPGPPPQAAAPDLEIVALQTTGRGRIGDCNQVVARLRNAGTVATGAAPEVRLQVAGDGVWTHTGRAPGPLAPGEIVEVWFDQVPLAAGLLNSLEAQVDPGDHIAESDEGNNRRRIPREPRLACGAPDPDPPAPLDLEVTVTARSGARAPAPIAGAEVTVTSPLGTGEMLARGATDSAGSVTLAVPTDPRVPVLRVTAVAPGCGSQTGLATPVAGGAPLSVAIELDCASRPAAAAITGRLVVEAALPGSLRVDDGIPQRMGLGDRVTIERPGATVRLRAASLRGTLYHDRNETVPATGERAVVVDAPPLQVTGEVDGAVIEDLRTALRWTLAAPAVAEWSVAGELCAGLERGGSSSWRLPDIDALFFLLAGPARVGALDHLGGADACCYWSETEHAGLRLTVYLDGNHIYGRGAGEGGVGALCVEGDAYRPDPLSVPSRYHDRIPGERRFTSQR